MGVLIPFAVERYSRRVYYFLFALIMVALFASIQWIVPADSLAKSLWPDWFMDPLTAFCFILLSLSFWALIPTTNKKRILAGKLLASIVIAIGIFESAAIFFANVSDIGQFLFANNKSIDNNSIDGKIPLNTSVGLVLCGLTLVLIHLETSHKRMPSHFIVMIVFLTGFIQLVARLYGVHEFTGLLKYFRIVLPTALCFILFSTAILLVYPDKGLAKEFSTNMSGSIAGRLLLPAALLVPVAVGELRILMHYLNPISTGIGTTMIVTSIVVILVAFILYNIVLLNRKDLLRKKALEELRQSEEMFRSLVSSVRDYAIFMTDSSGNVLTWNKGAESIKGYSASEIIGKNITTFYTDEDQKRGYPEYILKQAKEKGRYESEGWRVRKDGSIFWADVIITALYDKLGKVMGFAKVTRDNTESKKAKDLIMKFNKELKRQVEEKTGELTQTTQQLRQLSAYLQTAREDERRTIARDIHDGLGQMLTGIRMDLVWVQKKLGTADGTVSERLTRTLLLLNETRDLMRTIARGLHPAMLEDLGLVQALDQHCKEIADHSGIKINFNTSLEDIEPSNILPDNAINLYRIFQEALSNILKHACAQKVYVSLQNEQNSLTLNITDDGVGFRVNEIVQRKTLGLVSIRERTIMMGGEYRIYSIPGEGTTVEIKIPFKKT